MRCTVCNTELAYRDVSAHFLGKQSPCLHACPPAAVKAWLAVVDQKQWRKGRPYKCVFRHCWTELHNAYKRAYDATQSERDHDCAPSQASTVAASSGGGHATPPQLARQCSGLQGSSCSSTWDWQDWSGASAWTWRDESWLGAGSPGDRISDNTQSSVLPFVFFFSRASLHPSVSHRNLSARRSSCTSTRTWAALCRR